MTNHKSPDLKVVMDTVIARALAATDPAAQVREALNRYALPEAPGRLILVAIGKAAHTMASAVPFPVDAGIVITKDGHAPEPLKDPKIRVFEGAHPVPEPRNYEATRQVLDLCSDLNPLDQVLLLVSGGGSALFEWPLVEAEELANITEELLRSGASITELNCIRKRLSAVKGGRFAVRCTPASVHQIILSDVLGDPLDIIASGPCAVDRTSQEDVDAVIERRGLTLSPQALELLQRPLPQASELRHVTTQIAGNVRGLCIAACNELERQGFETLLLTTQLDSEAREAGRFLAAIAREYAGAERARPRAFVAGGETVVHVQGDGKGGRNQELVLAASLGMAGLEGVRLFSFGSDGTDGPTDAAGGWCDGASLGRYRRDPEAALVNNNAYPCLQEAGQLLITGPTGTNVNDLTVLLIQ